MIFYVLLCYAALYDMLLLFYAVYAAFIVCDFIIILVLLYSVLFGNYFSLRSRWVAM